MTSTSAYFAACAAATQPLMRTVFFLIVSVAVAMLDLLRRTAGQICEFLRLAAVQPGCDRECRIHADDARVEVQLGHALQATGRAFFNADAAAFAVVHEDFVEAVGTIGAHDEWLGTHEIAVVAGGAGAATEAAAGFLDGLFFGERQDYLLLRFFAAGGIQHVLLDPWKVGEVGSVHAVAIQDDIDGGFARLKRFAAQSLVQI